MIYNEDMFKQTIKAATVSIISFDRDINYNDDIIDCGIRYIHTLLMEPSNIVYCGNDPERYYYMIASHAVYAGLVISMWEYEGYSLERSLEGVLAIDSIAIFKNNSKHSCSDAIDSYISDVFDLAVGDLNNKYGQHLLLDNNEYILGMLMAFFIIGYNLDERYFL